MRAAHSIKGAAKVFDYEPIIQLAHSMEDCFVLAQEGKITLNDDITQILFKAFDMMESLIKVPAKEMAKKMLSERKRYIFLYKK